MSKRIRYFLGHLSISVIIALVIIGLVFFVWYPTPLAKAVGVTHIFLMLILIDVIVGPLLSLLVYKEGKKTLKMDLSVIILVQVLALGYGLFNIVQGRPVWLVQNGDRFEMVRQNEIDKTKLAQAKPEFQSNWGMPKFVTLQKELTVEKQNEQLFADLAKGVRSEEHPERYAALSTAKDLMSKVAQDIAVLSDFNSSEQVTQILKQYPDANVWLPLKALDVDMVVLINKEKGEVVKIVDLRPWK